MYYGLFYRSALTLAVASAPLCAPLSGLRLSRDPASLADVEAAAGRCGEA